MPRPWASPNEHHRGNVFALASTTQDGPAVAIRAGLEVVVPWAPSLWARKSAHPRYTWAQALTWPSGLAQACRAPMNEATGAAASCGTIRAEGCRTRRLAAGQTPSHRWQLQACRLMRRQKLNADVGVTGRSSYFRLNHAPNEIRTGAGPVTCATPPLARRGPRLRRHPLLDENYGFQLGRGLVEPQQSPRQSDGAVKGSGAHGSAQQPDIGPSARAHGQAYPQQILVLTPPDQALGDPVRGSASAEHGQAPAGAGGQIDAPAHRGTVQSSDVRINRRHRAGM
jgi:hypothetical protein